ncbi:MAG TPA: hypothetical protein VN802_08900 [Stellaceae bacterium]|nr:hypothetical protein [Stellaceae bacterium]
MAAYYVHWNAILRRLRIHRTSCVVCKAGAGKSGTEAGRGDAYDWEPASTYKQALKIADKLRRQKPVLNNAKARIDCGLCQPALARPRPRP